MKFEVRREREEERHSEKIVMETEREKVRGE